jgi:hypothetical protein
MMSKTNDVSTLDHRPLADSELDAVSGGMGLLGGIPGYSVPQPQTYSTLAYRKDIELK